MTKKINVFLIIYFVYYEYVYGITHVVCVIKMLTTLSKIIFFALGRPYFYDYSLKICNILIEVQAGRQCG